MRRITVSRFILQMCFHLIAQSVLFSRYNLCWERWAMILSALNELRRCNHYSLISQPTFMGISLSPLKLDWCTKTSLYLLRYRRHGRRCHGYRSKWLKQWPSESKNWDAVSNKCGVKRDLTSRRKMAPTNILGGQKAKLHTSKKPPKLLKSKHNFISPLANRLPQAKKCCYHSWS